MYPAELRYATTHEWAKVENGICTVGITPFAVELLTDVTHVELPAPGREVTAGAALGEIESVKAVSDLYAPIDGEVAANNQEAVVADPGVIAADPYGKGWLVQIKVKPGATLDHLMTADAYEKQIAAEGH